MTGLELPEVKKQKLEEKVGYSFNLEANLILALTHSSYANENREEALKSNERLEFLGDSILNTVISEFIYKSYENLAEGEMTRIRASVVCEQSLVKCSRNIGLGEYLMLGRGEEQTGGRMRTSILSDAFEALIGAIYIDGGMEPAKRFILSQITSLIEDSLTGIAFNDYKTRLQEIVQRSGDKKIVYEILEERGPDHSKTFVSCVKISEDMIAKGEGRSKKEAEQAAAKSALEKYGENF